MDTLNTAVREKAVATNFSGVVGIFRGEEALYREAFGFANIAEKRRNNLNTRFAVASGTKFFTALGIGSLIDEGKLSPETTVREIFGRDFTYIDSRATIGQLLSHISGIYDYYDEDLDIDMENYFVEIPWYRLETPSDYLPLFESRQPKFSPGERFSYSNGGFIFSGVIIEHITGKLYRDYIREKVFDPAEMTDSGYYAFNRLPENTAYGYKTNTGDEPETNIYNLPIRGGSDGGAYTTIDDVHQMWKAFMSSRILSENLTREFLTPRVNVSKGVDYGYGIYITEYAGRKMYFLAGGDAGVGFISRYIPEEAIQFTVMSNRSDGEEEVSKTILENLGEVVTG